jgi:uncharacterized protein with HEPN domain
VPPRDWHLRIEDMIDAVDAISGFVKDTNFDAFCQDRKTVDAVVRNLEVIGEAARFIPEQVRQRFPDVPWENIIGMRSVLIHEYFGVDFEILWATVQNDLPTFGTRLKSILDQS